MKIDIPAKGDVVKAPVAGALAHALERDGSRDLIVDANPTLNLACALWILLDSAFKIVQYRRKEPVERSG